MFIFFNVDADFRQWWEIGAIEGQKFRSIDFGSPVRPNQPVVKENHDFTEVIARCKN